MGSEEALIEEGRVVDRLAWLRFWTALKGRRKPWRGSLLEGYGYAKVSSAAHSARALLRVTRWSLQGANAVWAGVAQLVEHLICNQRVGGSSPFASSSSPQQEKKDGFGCTALAVLALQTSGHSFKVMYPLDSQLESATGLMG